MNIINKHLLDKVKVNFTNTVDFSHYPFSLDIIKNLKDIELRTQVTFFVGENGTGKSTILAAIAHKAGFGAEGGSKHINFKTAQEKAYTGTQNLAEYLTLSWRNKPKDGYFFKAESFFNIASYIDSIGGEKSYGGKSLHDQSHGESFLSFFENRLSKGGFFIFDEPEAALSPQRQLSLMVIINEICKNPNSQFIIASHSPILLAYPNATIYSCDSNYLTSIAYTQTKHYQITKKFLDNPDHHFYHLFKD